MKQCRIWLYKTPKKFGKKYIVNYLISLRTLSKYSHIEIEDCEYQIMYTSTMRGEENGTVCRHRNKVLEHLENWDFIQLTISNTQHRFLFWWLNLKVKANKGYSKWDIMRFISPIHFEDILRDICSELVNNGLVTIFVVKGFGIVSPKKVCKKLVKQGNKIKKGADVEW